MRNEITNKEFFARYGIFVGIIIVLFGLLIYPIKVSQKSWINNLRSNIEFVLDEREPNGWIVESPVPIKNSFCLSAACYNARNRTSGELYKAVILRTQTLYGPLPGVFLVDSEENVEFVGFASLHGRIAEQIKNFNKSDKSERISFWKEKIPYILKDN